MENKNKIIDNQLYRIAYKQGCHVNTKINSDGTKCGIQFSNENNKLTGPVDLMPVNRNENIEVDHAFSGASRTFGQIITEDLLVPVARDAIEQLLDIGIQHFNLWMNEKTKETMKKQSAFFSTVKASVKGEEIKASQIIRNQKNNNLHTISDASDLKKENPDSSMTLEELNEVFAPTKKTLYFSGLH